jgi:hypothetical protein
MTQIAPFQASFTVTGLTSGNVEITINSGQGEFSFGPANVGQMNGFTIAPAVTGSSAQFQEIYLTSGEVFIQGNPTGAATAIVVSVWIAPNQTGQVNGNVNLPSGAVFTPHGPAGQSGQQTGSGGWYVSF